MIKKYALDPAVAQDKTVLHRFLDGLGVDQGRVLAEYPSYWWRLLYESLPNASTDLQRTQLIEDIKRLRLERHVSISPRIDNYDPKASWIDNVTDHLVPVLDAGVYAEGTVTGSPHPKLYPAATLKPFTLPAYWKVRREIVVGNKADEWIEHLLPLLELSSSAAIMDPFFAPVNRFVAFIRKLLAAAPRLKAIYLHGAVKRDALEKEAWKSAWAQRLEKLPKRGVTIHIVRWKKNGSNSPHRRWVVNAKGGIRIDTGVAEDGNTNDLILMDAAMSMELWTEFGRDNRPERKDKPHERENKVLWPEEGTYRLHDANEYQV